MHYMDDLDRIMRRLEGKTTMQLQKLAAKVGNKPHWQTFYKVQQGLIPNPSIRTVEAIKRALA